MAKVDQDYKYLNLVLTYKELQAIPVDPNKPEDVDTKAQDHAYDALDI